MTYHDILNIIITNKYRIIKNSIVSTFVLFLILFLLYPITYRATVSVLPPENNQSFGGIGSLLSGQDFSSLLTGGFSNASSQLFEEILRSRSASEYVIKKLNLTDYYNADNIYDAVKDLQNDINIEITKEGILKLDIDTKTSFIPLIFSNKDSIKKLSADLSNTFIEALDKINREKMSSKARKTREYIEGQLVVTKSNLDSVETALMKFQEKNKTISLPDQLTAAIDAAAKLKTEMVKTEVQIGLMQTNLREDNKALIALKNKLNQLKDQFDKMEMGNQDYLLTFKDVPELGKKLANLLREVKIQNEVYLLLQQEFYKEKIQENRDVPTVQILDKAIPPLRKSSPKVVISTISGGIFFFLLISFVFVINEKRTLSYKNKEKD